jgi:hypothetical protein
MNSTRVWHWCKQSFVKTRSDNIAVGYDKMRKVWVGKKKWKNHLPSAIVAVCIETF